jgi:pimeloyl-ACP methyl ester carboxylesterase
LWNFCGTILSAETLASMTAGSILEKGIMLYQGRSIASMMISTFVNAPAFPPAAARLLILLMLALLMIDRAGAEPVHPRIAPEIIEFKSGDTTLSGTLTIPLTPVAAVVVVNGSGREPQLLSMASYMAAKGIAVMTYDKRGTGRSGGIYVGPEVGTNNVDPSNLALLASDASAALGVLTGRQSIRNIPVGFIGFSQAGWIIPMAAKSNRAAAFMVIVSGPVVTTREQMRFQVLTRNDANFWNKHTEDEVREHIRNDPDPFPFGDTDPVDTLRDLSIPGLWLFGERDMLVPVSLSLERLTALSDNGKPFESLLFAGGDHMLLMTKPEAFDVAISWIQKHGKK